MSDWSSLPGGARTKLKIIFLGDQSVGKSSIIDKYIKEQFDSEQNPTVGIDFHIKNVSWGGKNYRLQLWDTAGQERFRSLIPSYLKDANCAILVFDLTRAPTLENIKVWENMFEEYRKIDAIKLLVGNKSDLKSERIISQEEGKKFAEKYKAKYIQVSAKTSQKLGDLFEMVIAAIEEQNQKRQTIPIPQEWENEKKKDVSVDRNLNKFKINVKDQHHNVVNGLSKGEEKKKKNENCC